MKISLKARVGTCAVAAVLAGVFLYVYGLPLERPGIMGEEAFFSYEAVTLETRWSWSEALMPSPYTGGLKTLITLSCYRLLGPSVRLLRLISLSLGALFLAAAVCLAAALGGRACALALGLLLLADPNVFMSVRQDTSGATLAAAFLCAGVALLVLARRTVSRRKTAAAGFC